MKTSYEKMQTIEAKLNDGDIKDFVTTTHSPEGYFNAMSAYEPLIDLANKLQDPNTPKEEQLAELGKTYTAIIDKYAHRDMDFERNAKTYPSMALLSFAESVARLTLGDGSIFAWMDLCLILNEFDEMKWKEWKRQ